MASSRKPSARSAPASYNNNLVSGGYGAHLGNVSGPVTHHYGGLPPPAPQKEVRMAPEAPTAGAVSAHRGLGSRKRQGLRDALLVNTENACGQPLSPAFRGSAILCKEYEKAFDSFQVSDTNDAYDYTIHLCGSQLKEIENIHPQLQYQNEISRYKLLEASNYHLVGAAKVRQGVSFEDIETGLWYFDQALDEFQKAEQAIEEYREQETNVRNYRLQLLELYVLIDTVIAHTFVITNKMQNAKQKYVASKVEEGVALTVDDGSEDRNAAVLRVPIAIEAIKSVLKVRGPLEQLTSQIRREVGVHQGDLGLYLKYYNEYNEDFEAARESIKTVELELKKSVAGVS